MSSAQPELQLRVDSGRRTAGKPPLVPAGPPAAALAQRRRRSDEKRWFPWLVPTIFVVDVVLFVITMSVNNCPKNSTSKCVLPFLGRFSFQPLRENPLLGPSTSALQKMGGLLTDKIVHQHQGWRLVTCIWLHAGVVHLLVNMLCLLLIGIKLEQEFGFIRVGLLYVVSGIGGSLLSALFDQSTISVGASGALFGLLGGMLSELLINWTIYANKFAAMMTLIIIIALNLALGILPHVDNFAHIGGLVTGFLIGFVILLRPQFSYVRIKNSNEYPNGTSKRKHSMCQYVMLIIALVLLIVGFTVGLILVFRGYNANDHCSWCHYLSCVPTSKWNCNSGTQSCEYYTIGNQLTLTCQSSGKSRNYTSVDSNSTQVVHDLCVQLCT